MIIKLLLGIIFMCFVYFILLNGKIDMLKSDIKYLNGKIDTAIKAHNLHIEQYYIDKDE